MCASLSGSSFPNFGSDRLVSPLGSNFKSKTCFFAASRAALIPRLLTARLRTCQRKTMHVRQMTIPMMVQDVRELRDGLRFIDVEVKDVTESGFERVTGIGLHVPDEVEQL